MDKVRRSLGVCPQFSSLYASLTVLESLMLFGRLKGRSAAEAHQDAVQIVDALGLTDVSSLRTPVLSGGQQRKLNVALSFTGGSRTIILDEPSSGMDVESQLQLWATIRSMKQGRTIILTTHSMTEAEALGDRIAIMSAGSVQCLGTSLFLKRNLGTGYTLSLFVDNASDDQVQSFVSRHVPEARLEARSGAEFIFAIPQEVCQRRELALYVSGGLTFGQQEPSTIGALLTQLEAAKENRTSGIVDYFLTPSRLEDVFLRIAREHEERLGLAGKEVPPMPDFQIVESGAWNQILVMCTLLLSELRSDVVLFLSLVLPVAFALLSIGSPSLSSFTYWLLYATVFITSGANIASIRVRA